MRQPRTGGAVQGKRRKKRKKGCKKELCTYTVAAHSETTREHCNKAGLSGRKKNEAKSEKSRDRMI